MKKLVLCLVILLALMLSACAPTGDATTAQEGEAATTEGDAAPAEEGEAATTVKLYHRFVDSHKDALDVGFDICREQIPGLDLQVSNVSGAEYEVQLPVVLSSDSPPDIYALWPGGRPVFQAEYGRIVPITEFYQESIAPVYVDGVDEGVVETDGEIYVMPFNLMPNAIYYRTDMFEEYGLEPPATWDEFMVVLETLKENGETPIALGTGRGWEPLFWFDYMLLRVAGAEFREDLMWGKESYTDPKVIETMELWGEMVKAGYFNEDMTSLAWADMTPMVAEGRAAMMLMGPWAVNTLSEAGLTPGEDFDMFPFPNINPDIPDATEGAMEGWALTGANEENAEIIQEFLKCIAGVEQQSAYTQLAVRLQPNPEVTMDVYADDIKPFIEKLSGLTGTTFHQNMELATLPPITDVAKREFPRFLTYPDEYMTVLEALEERAQTEFAE